jgi:hypothetical protein
VSKMTAVQVSKLISLKSDQHRLLVFQRDRRDKDAMEADIDLEFD